VKAPAIADPCVLGRILLLQSTLQAAPDEERLGKMVARGLADLPGARGCAVCIGGEIHRRDFRKVPLPLSCPVKEGDGNGFADGCAHRCPLDGMEGIERFVLRTIRSQYGALLLEVEDEEALGPYLPFMANTANFVAMHLENARNLEALEEANLTLEAQVEERTKALRESEERMQLIINGAALGTWDWNVVTGEAIFNERLAEMLGYAPGEAPPRAITWEKRIHPDDAPGVVKVLNDHLKGETDFYEAEYRLRHKSGRWVWVLDKGRVIERDMAGNPLRACGTHLNITDRKRAEAEIAAALEEKEVLLREIHHRVKNNMQEIVGMLRLYSSKYKEVPKEFFNDCRDRVGAMSLIHEVLYQSESLSRIDLETYLRKLWTALVRAHGASREGINLEIAPCRASLGTDRAFAVGTVIVELVGNAFKHAFPDGRRGTVSIRLLRLEERGEIELVVQDDGVGLPEGMDIGRLPSLGLRLVAATVTRQLGGSIQVEGNGGTKFTIRFNH